MKPRNLFLALAGALALQMAEAQQQYWNSLPGGNVINNNEWMGADVNSTIPLSFETRVNQPMQWRTNNVLRMRLNESLPGQPVNNFPSVNLSGHLGIGSPVPPQALTLIHINNNGGFFSGFRPWMRTGVSMSEFSDWMYVGTKNEGMDRIDAVINWGDNKEADPTNGPDALRFIFTRTMDSSTIAPQMHGLELARVIPDPLGDQGYFGIGDFFTPAFNPTERLDVLNGRVRIRQLPNDPSEPLKKFLVVDEKPGPDFGVVKWRYLPCDWTLNPTAQNNLSTAFGPVDPDCPDNTDAVGIGVDLMGGASPAKLIVANKNFGIGIGSLTTRPTAGTNIGISTDVTGSSYLNAGIEVNVHGNSSYTRGIQAQTNGATGIQGIAGSFLASDNASSTVGAQGISDGGIDYSIGLRGQTTGTALQNFGVLGVAPSASNSWAGYFVGNVNVVGTGYYVNGNFVASDAQFKINVQPLEDPLAILMQLHPDRYEFLVDEFPQMNFPSGEHGGFIAQEVEVVLPSLVSQTRIAAETDSLGNEISPAVDYKAVNYAGLTPYIVGALQQQQGVIQQQQASIDQQNTRMAELEDRINQCCAANGSGMAPQSGERSTTADSNVQEQRLLIIPNPVADLTTLEYYVPKAGQVSLQVSTSDGKPLETLREEKAEAGAYNYAWNTTKLAAGTYFCTFMLDGAVVVKRAVKVK
ncbi:MAG: tail fiber domain-containing protein [Flavobacteriales bacterium]|jgi:hypothetical protein|nr:tail fiber domain-containing protein [Flavobacteriales bacterium]